MAVRGISLLREDQPKRRGHLARAWSRLIRKKVAVVSIITLLLVYSSGIFAPLISAGTGYGYNDQNYTEIRQGPSLKHWAGTDRAGRDVLTRVLWGIQNTVVITVVSMLTGGIAIGVTLGLLSGYFGGRIDALIMRIGEVFSSFPDIFLVIILAATLRPRFIEWVRSLENAFDIFDGIVRLGIVDYFIVSIALVSFGWIGMARLVRGQVLYLKETQYVESAKATGASTRRILFLHLFPNAISPVVVTVSMSMGLLVGTEIILGFLGLGIQPPRPSLGVMLRDAGNIGTLQNEPWMLLAPGTAAFLLVLGWNLLGDALNDVLNPRTR